MRICVYKLFVVVPAVNRLASCESNKDRLARKALPSYMRLLQGGCAEEQIVATQGIWSLAFSEAARQLLSQDMACMEGTCTSQQKISISIEFPPLPSHVDTTAGTMLAHRL